MNVFYKLNKNKKILDIVKSFKKNNTVLVENCINSQKSQLIYSLNTHFKGQNLIICEDEIKAKRYFDDLKFFFKNDVYFYPSKDFVFYNADVKSSDITKYRFEVIKNVIDNKNTTIVLSIEALFDRLVKKDIFLDFIFNFKIGDKIDVDNLSKKLVFMGYEKYPAVEGIGQFSIRGGIIDIFSPIFDNAFRIELYDDEIDSIRLLDINSGRSIENTTEVLIYPMREIVYTQKELDKAIKNIKKEYEKAKKKIKNNKEVFDNLTKNIKKVLEDLTHKKTVLNMEKYTQFFYDEKVSLLDYLDEEITIYIDEPEKVRKKALYIQNEFLESLKGRILKGNMLPCQNKMIFSYDDILNFIDKYKKVLLINFSSNIKDFDIQKTIKLDVKMPSISNMLKNDMNVFYEQISNYKNLKYFIVFLAGSTTRCERLTKDLNERELNAIFLDDAKLKEEDYKTKRGIIYVVRGSLNSSFLYEDEKFVIISNKEVFGEEKLKKLKTIKKKKNRIKSFTDLKVGEFVVHENHGVAIFKGIEKIVTDRISKDYLKLGYEDDGVLYVSVNQLDMVQKYIAGGSKSPKLSKLGNPRWDKAKTKAKKSVQSLAKDLVELYAKRQQAHGYMYAKDNVWQTEFEDAFPYEETDDQVIAIEEVKVDMESNKVMDRLICGDVGFGKTEVAIRASFKAVQDYKQVVFLVPTTLLAEQHYNTFSTRMKNYPIEVDLLSRFKTKSQQKKTLKKMIEGKVDILIGTHRVLSKDIEFKDLGLVIVDEEQRFGVKHKEHLKNLRENVDVLTLSATPIPRTLHMSMAGIRDMSLLEEPPRERMPVQTYVLEYDLDSIKNAITREISRDGQVYFLHNSVSTIDEMVGIIKKVVPEATVCYAHGQMNERELERVMFEFMANNINVLVCTTIIETGLDIPNVNTIIINNSDTMGLSQLYQLRGRVGRSYKTSFAYLLYKRDKVLREVSEKRLQTIKEFTEFGSGFKVAMRDLEIRGAGSLLGSEQHGHMDIIGYEMYCKLLDNEVRKLKGEEVEDIYDITIDLAVNAFINDKYIKNEIQKLQIYKKIALIRTENDFLDIQDELIDKYGEIPKVVQNLLDIALMKSYANNIGVVKIAQLGNKISIKFREKHKVDMNKLQKIMLENKRLSFDIALNYKIENNKEDYVYTLKDLFINLKQ